MYKMLGHFVKISESNKRFMIAKENATVILFISGNEPQDQEGLAIDLLLEWEDIPK